VGIYARYVLPRLVEYFVSNPTVERRRRILLDEVSGQVLEIGCGTGLNIPWYTNRVSHLTLTDPSREMLARAQCRTPFSPVRIAICAGNAESLPFADCTFDCVVSTWTLCSIADVHRGLEEVFRVLRPSGTFHFLDHGLSPDPCVRLLQKILKPLFLMCGGGCRPDRDIKLLLESHGFVFRRLETLYLEGMTRTAGYLYTGVAEKPDTVTSMMAGQPF
jgi:ubiquinone/menaquinone biosynthesis C-methylase UbiE